MLYLSLIAAFLTAVYVYLSALAWVLIPINFKWLVFGLTFTPWRLYLIISSFLNLFTFIAILFLPESPKFLLAMNRKEETLIVLQTIYQRNTGCPIEVGFIGNA